MNIKLIGLITLLLIALGAALVFLPQQPVTTSAPVQEAAANVVTATEVTIYKSPTCGCCGSYEQYLVANGFQVKSIPTDKLSDMKHEYGIPHDMQSCHTAVIAGYFVEGHVPVEAIQALLTQNPAIDGIALPGMPMGSPGMGGEKSGPFEIYAITDGNAELFMSL